MCDRENFKSQRFRHSQVIPRQTKSFQGQQKEPYPGCLAVFPCLLVNLALNSKDINSENEV